APRRRKPAFRAGVRSPFNFPRIPKMMKKLSSVLMMSLTAGMLLSGCGKSEAPQQAAPAAAPAPAAPARIVVGLDDNFPPMGFRNEKNELVGFDIDLAREAAKRL